MKPYKQIFLDFDGVVADTNTRKEQNILAASLKFLSESEANNFVSFFTNNNGIPREKKIFSYFNDQSLANGILNSYNVLNENLLNASMILGLENFLNKNMHTPIYILSGGDMTEIEAFLTHKSIRKYFTEIMCGPKTKEENLALIDVIKPALFVGDSAHDYEVARQFDLDFIFLYGSSQEVDYNDSKYPDALFFRHFLEFNNYKNDED